MRGLQPEPVQAQNALSGEAVRRREYLDPRVKPEFLEQDLAEVKASARRSHCHDGRRLGVEIASSESRFPGVYAIGDVVSIPLKLGKPLPKAGVFAHAEAEVVARNIAALVKGEPAKERFQGLGECFVEIGDGKAGFGGGDFYAEPTPVVTVRPPSRRFHFGKVLFEKLWLYTRV